MPLAICYECFAEADTMEQELPLGPFTESESLLTKRVRYTNNGTAPISVLGYTNDR